MIDIQQLKNIPRYKDIGIVLVRHGFEHVAEFLGLTSLATQALRLIRRRREPEVPISLARRIREAMAELGPTFVKLGQILSTRRDLLPEEFIEEFSQLQDNVPPMDVEKVRRVFLTEMGKGPEELFETFDPIPLAAASIGQVHRARTRDGRDVAIKVQREGLRSVIRSDIDILYFIARRLRESDLIPPTYDVIGIVDEFAKSIRQELDYHRESQNIETFRRNFEGDPTVTFPRVIHELCTSRLLCMELIRGVRADRFREVECDPKVIATNGAIAILKMTFRDGCFHADPHPGNLLILPGNVICFMDFGTIGRLSHKMRDSISWLFIYLMNRDYDAMARELVGIGDPLDDVNIDTLSAALMDTLDYYHGAKLEQIDMGVLIRSISRLLIRYRLSLPSNYTLMLKSVVTIEGLGKSLYPDFDITALARPYIEKMVMDRWTPRRVAHDMEILTLDATAFLKRTPALIGRILAKLNRGALSLDFHHRGLNDLTDTLDRASNRLAFALVISALLVSSSMIMVMSPGGENVGIPKLAILGYLLALFLGGLLAIGVLRSRGP